MQIAGQQAAEAWKISFIGHSSLNGRGDGMQLALKDHFLFVGHLAKAGTTILDVANPASPRVVYQQVIPPHVHTHKVQIVDDLLLVNYEQFGAGTPERTGFQILDISTPLQPQEIGFFSTGGKGVHRMWYAGGRYVYLSAVPEGFSDQIFLIADISDPTSPQEVARWWVPGMWTAGGETPTWPSDRRYAAHHAVVSEDRAYLGFWDAGAFILDISDPSKPSQIAHLSWPAAESGNTHTALPLPERSLLIVTDEAITDECQEGPRHVRVVDITEEGKPQDISKFPVPQGNFCQRGHRFGPHNLHENRPGSFVSDEMIFVTYFNAGLRVVDLSVPERPEEIAHYIPATPEGQQAAQTNDVFVAENGLIYISDRINGGIDILELQL